MNDPNRGTRSLRTRLAALLTDKQKATVGFTAESIGVADNTLRTLLRDDWDQLARETIEKVCDRFGLDIAQLFELVPDGFWRPFVESGEYVVLRDANEYLPRDAKARTIVTTFLADTFPTVVGTARDLTDAEEIVECIRNHNCIVVGSPRTNRVTEVVFCRYFRAAPFDTSEGNRHKLPVRFVFPKSRVLKSAMAEPWNTRLGRNACGVCDADAHRMIARADWWPIEEYLRRTINRGKDVGVMLIVNRPLEAKKDVKTIVLAGFSAMGTEAAAVALTREFRNLEPQAGARHVLGVVEGIFKKTTPHHDKRDLISYRWKHLEGGRKRIQPNETTESDRRPKKREPPAR